jgi:hypothetical protein
MSFRCTIAAAFATAALVAPAGALPQPTHDIATTHTRACRAAAPREHRSRTAAPGITFTNPGCRSRGPGAGAGLL